MAFSAPSPHLFLLSISTPPGRILPSLCGPVPNVITPPPLQHNPRTSPPLLPLYVRTSSMFKRTAALPHTFVKLPSVLSPKHYAALTQLPLTYPWARLVLDLKELLLSFDRHLITCLIANHMQGNNPPHPGTVLSSFLQHLAQLILLIIAPHDTDDAPPFLHHLEIYNFEFWHAHLNYACTRFATSHGSDRLLGNQICHWTKGTSEMCMKVTHLVVFLPPALGAYVLSQHHTKKIPLSALLMMLPRKMTHTLSGSIKAPS